jgi:hypothetical protein
MILIVIHLMILKSYSFIDNPTRMTDKLKDIVIDYLNKEYSGLIPYETDGYPNFIFFMKDGEVIFDYNNKNGYVYISYEHIWSFLESFFGLEYEEIQDLTKQWVEEHYKLDVTTTVLSMLKYLPPVEEHYKLDVTTTLLFPIEGNDMVEEHYKLDVTTTLS